MRQLTPRRRRSFFSNNWSLRFCLRIWQTLQPPPNISTTQKMVYDVAMDTMRQSHATVRMNEDRLRHQQQFQAVQQFAALQNHAGKPYEPRTGL
jgi:hypothetical protein